MQWPAITALAILMALIHTAASRGKAIKRGETEIFPSSLVLRGAYFVLVLLFVALGVGFTNKLGWRETGWPLFIFFGVPALVIANWPATILVNKQNVQRFQPFRKSVTIPKDEILAVVFDRKRLSTLVCGKNASITHGNYHVASEEFRRLLSQWCSIDEQ